MTGQPSFRVGLTEIAGQVVPFVGKKHLLLNPKLETVNSKLKTKINPRPPSAP